MGKISSLPWVLFSGILWALFNSGKKISNSTFA